MFAGASSSPMSTASAVPPMSRASWLVGAVVGRAIEADDVRAFEREGARRGLADAARGAGDERDLLLERPDERRLVDAPAARAVTVIGCAVTNAERAESTKRSTGAEAALGAAARRGRGSPSRRRGQSPWRGCARSLRAPTAPPPPRPTSPSGGRARTTTRARPRELRDERLEELVEPAQGLHVDDAGRVEEERVELGALGAANRALAGTAERLARRLEAPPPSESGRRTKASAPAAVSDSARVAHELGAGWRAPIATRASASGAAARGPGSRLSGWGRGMGRPSAPTRARARGFLLSSRRKSLIGRVSVSKRPSR